MKVILRTDIDKLGKQGDVKNVSEGYARNYLLPKDLVFVANPQNLKIWEREKQKLEKQKQKELQKARELAEKIEKLSITIPVTIGESGKLFGSVTSTDIANVLKDSGFSINKHSIELKEPIKDVGVFVVDVKVHPEVVAKPKVWIVEEKKESEG
ncbi:MAG: 50S ribosomal protein L9 [Endomicrobiales bacterium]|nr:50S ribosomal protein L9 [Endomicrobiales bacterium]